MRALIIILVLFSIISCSASLSTTMASWKGYNHEQLIKSWGPPDSTSSWETTAGESYGYGFWSLASFNDWLGIKEDGDSIWKRNYIAAVMKGSPAYKAGLKIGDKIIQIDSEDAKSVDLMKVAEQKDGSISLLISREEELINISIPNKANYMTADIKTKAFVYLDSWSHSWTEDAIEMDLETGELYDDTVSYSESGICNKKFILYKFDSEWGWQKPKWIIVNWSYKNC